MCLKLSTGVYSLKPDGPVENWIPGNPTDNISVASGVAKYCSGCSDCSGAAPVALDALVFN